MNRYEVIYVPKGGTRTIEQMDARNLDDLLRRLDDRYERPQPATRRNRVVDIIRIHMVEEG